jgi:hypothetical protein
MGRNKAQIPNIRFLNHLVADIPIHKTNRGIGLYLFPVKKSEYGV